MHALALRHDVEPALDAGHVGHLDPRPGGRLAERLAPLFEKLGAALSKQGCTLSVMLTDDAGISSYNERFAGKAEPTDVLSFAFCQWPHCGGGRPRSRSSAPRRCFSSWGRSLCASRQAARCS